MPGYRKGDGVEGAIVPRIFNAGVHGPLPPTEPESFMSKRRFDWLGFFGAFLFALMAWGLAFGIPWGLDWADRRLLP